MDVYNAISLYIVYILTKGYKDHTSLTSSLSHSSSLSDGDNICGVCRRLLDVTNIAKKIVRLK